MNIKLQKNLEPSFCALIFTKEFVIQRKIIQSQKIQKTRQVQGNKNCTETIAYSGYLKQQRCWSCTSQKMKFSTVDLLSKRDLIRSFMRICSHLL